jgi:hypothetical protein
LYNNTDAPLVVADAAAANAQRDSGVAPGWAVFSGYDQTNEPGGPLVWFVIPAGTFIPPRAHYLITTPGYSLGTYPGSDGATAAGDLVAPARVDTKGIALQTSSAYTLAAGPPLTRVFQGVTLDAVGFAAPPLTISFGEGTKLQPADGLTTNGEFSFARKLASGTPQDTNDNAADFLFISTDGGTYDGVQSQLGAPGPENTSSPIQHNTDIKAALIDPLAAATNAPNRVRDPAASGALLGTLAVRRKFTNKTGQPVTTLRFRITDITSAPATAGTADLRALPGQAGSFNVMLTSGATVVVQRLTLEQPPAQPAGGSLNSALSAAALTLATPLAPNASINVEFLLGVQQGGSFRFFINVEASSGPAGFNAPQKGTRAKALAGGAR